MHSEAATNTFSIKNHLRNCEQKVLVVARRRPVLPLDANVTIDRKERRYFAANAGIDVDKGCAYGEH